MVLGILFFLEFELVWLKLYIVRMEVLLLIRKVIWVLFMMFCMFIIFIKLI